MAGMYRMKDLLELLLRERAGELRLASGEAPFLIAREKKVSIDLPEITSSELRELLQTVANEEQLAELGRCGDVHFIYVFQNSARFAISAVLKGDDALAVNVKNIGR
jgi:Tfp pilus assembly pilus retraction ATPase PilT